MALDPNIALQTRPINVLSAIQGGLQTGEMIRNSGLRDAILGNQVAQGQQNLAIGNQSQQLNEQTLVANEFTAQDQQRNLAIKQTKGINELLTQIKTLPLADRAGALANAAQHAPRIGLDPQRIMQQGISDAELDQTIAATAGFLGEQQQKAVSQVAFEELIKDFTEDDKVEARRIKAGLAPRAVGTGAKVEDIGGVATLVNPTEGTAEELIVSRTDPETGEIISKPVTTESVAQSKASIAGKTTAVKDAVAQSKKFFDSLPALNEKMAVYDDIIATVNSGASTGKVANMFPSLTKATIELDNLQKRLGLNVIQNTTFGSLSESELAFALDAALPKDLSGQDLVAWVNEKKRVQQKLINYANDAAEYLGTGDNTISGFLELQKVRNSSKGAQSGGMTVEQADSILQGFQ